ncbi:MAG TPA: efflux RND transporter permease subunit, partial [Polyangiaceae bacterium]|nr:efflux RND transporter permease subunit [Polyangiaceae bacterium]
MIGRVVAWCTRHPWWVLLCAAAAAFAGELARRSVRRDAIPDLSAPQIVLLVDWMGHPADEVASRITGVLTAALTDVPDSTDVRGVSMTGMAYVDVVFDSTTHLEAARSAIAARIERARPALPEDVRLHTGPLASSTGWVFEYALIDPHRRQSGLALRRLQDDELRPALTSLPGVAEVASVGGETLELLVELEAERLRERGVAFSDAVAAIRSAVRAGDEVAPGNVEALSVPGAQPSRIADVGRVRATADMPTGLADFGGIQPAVGGIVIAKRDADVVATIDGVKAALESARARLPPGVELVTAYDRSDLIERSSRTVVAALAEEIAVVVVVVLVFLGHGRSALVPLLSLPPIVLLTYLGMWLLRVPATIMSVGGIGIALGIAVDADIVAIEACHRRLEALGPAASRAERRARLVAAACTLAPAVLTSLVVTALTFLPVFAFTGESGRLLRPLALTKTLVIAAAALVSVTLAPALRERLVRGRIVPEFENPLTRALVGAYRPFVHFALARPAFTLVTAALAAAACLPIATRLGGEFLPRVDEGDLLFMPTTRGGVSAHQAASQLFQQDKALRDVKEVSSVFGKVGRADTATDPAPFSMAETTIRLKPRSEWPRVARAEPLPPWTPDALRRAARVLWPAPARRTLAELVDELDRVAHLPGWVSAWTAPARARMDMMATGVRTPVGVRVVASDPARLDAIGGEVRARLAKVPGTRSAAYESIGGEPRLELALDDAALEQYDVDPAEARSIVDLLSSGGLVRNVVSGGRAMRLRISPDVGMPSMPGAPVASERGPADLLRDATVRARGGGPPVPLSLLGRPAYLMRPSTIRTERGETVAYVYVDLEPGVDVAGYVVRARQTIEAATAQGAIPLLRGERIDWTGQYALLIAGERRLAWVAPAVALSMLVLLVLQFRSVSGALIVFASVPFALVGSFWTLFLLGYPWSAPVWAGVLATVGLSMQTGVVMVVYIDEEFFRRVREGR